MIIILETVPKQDIRNNDVGDWYTDEHGTRRIKVLETNSDKYSILLFLHEFIEQSLCEDRGIKESDVTAFDYEFNKSGKEGEAGDDTGAPYRHEHFIAETIERLMANELGVDWEEYNKKVNEL
jgi:hypothetical protein